jgi:hypothetical protein
VKKNCSICLSSHPQETETSRRHLLRLRKHCIQAIRQSVSTCFFKAEPCSLLPTCVVSMLIGAVITPLLLKLQQNAGVRCAESFTEGETPIHVC